VVDTQVAGALIRAAQAARMLGARVVLSGISAEVAQTLVHIGAEMQDMIALRSLQQAIAYALAQRQQL
jgi:rsbT co-antagonist protein RsbR